jgi:hypothetical protein
MAFAPLCHHDLLRATMYLLVLLDFGNIGYLCSGHMAVNVIATLSLWSVFRAGFGTQGVCSERQTRHSSKKFKSTCCHDTDTAANRGTTATSLRFRQQICDGQQSVERFVIFSAAGAGFNDHGKKTLAHPEYHIIQSWWHPTKNLGKLPGDFPHRCGQTVWLRCPGCRHECGRHHEWQAMVASLTSNLERNGGHIVCPSCESKGGLCECQSVANHSRLSRE